MMFDRVRARARQRRRGRRARQGGLAAAASVLLLAATVFLSSAPGSSSVRTTPGDGARSADGQGHDADGDGGRADGGSGREPGTGGGGSGTGGGDGPGGGVPGSVPRSSPATVPGGPVDVPGVDPSTATVPKPVGTTTTTRPAPAPSGGEIAYARADRIWLLRADGSQAGALTDGSHKLAAPDWAPDGRRLVAVSWRTDATGVAVGRLVTVGLDGNVQPITGEGRYSVPKWSPDGSRIAFTRNVASPGWGPPEFELWIVNADGSNERKLLAPTDPGFSWSPDGARLAAVCQGGLCTLRPDGSDVRLIGDTVHHTSPTWSPDGQRLAVGVSGPGGNRLMTMRLDGTDRRLVTEVFTTQVDWSPDGRTLVFAGQESSCGGCLRVSRVDADGSGRRILAADGSGETHPSWRPPHGG